MPALETITDELLISDLNAATDRIVLIAPGVWPPLAEAVASTWTRLGRDRVTVILDSTAEVCRLGYGSLEGLEILQSAATAVGGSLGQESGVRICVVIADQKTFVFSPTPRLLESPPGNTLTSEVTQPKANGIVLDAAPPMLEKDLGISSAGDATRILGNEQVTTEKLQFVVSDLKTNPPKKFDLARAVNVYNAKIQFVEFRVDGCRLSEHKARLPKNLLQVIKGNQALSKKIENSIQLLDRDDVLITDPKLSQETVFKQRDRIYRRYLKSVDRIGTVIKREEKSAFLKEVEKLRADVDKFSKHVERILSERFRETAEQLAGELLDSVLIDMPDKWKNRFGNHPNPERVQWHIVDTLLKAFGDPAKKVGRMKVDTVFKDVTYDMLKDETFRTIINEYFPDLPLLEENKAVPESSPASTNDKSLP